MGVTPTCCKSFPVLPLYCKTILYINFRYVKSRQSHAKLRLVTGPGCVKERVSDKDLTSIVSYKVKNETLIVYVIFNYLEQSQATVSTEHPNPH